MSRVRDEASAFAYVPIQNSANGQTAVTAGHRLFAIEYANAEVFALGAIPPGASFALNSVAEDATRTLNEPRHRSRPSRCVCRCRTRRMNNDDYETGSRPLRMDTRTQESLGLRLTAGGFVIDPDTPKEFICAWAVSIAGRFDYAADAWRLSTVRVGQSRSAPLRGTATWR